LAEVKHFLDSLPGECYDARTREFGKGYWILSTGEFTGYEEKERDGKYRVFVRTKDEAVSDRRN
jgi:hypothetical protein